MLITSVKRGQPEAHKEIKIPVMEQMTSKGIKLRYKEQGICAAQIAGESYESFLH